MMDEAMIGRVMDELRPNYPHDDDEMLRRTATKTTLGATIAVRLACKDIVRALAAEEAEQDRLHRERFGSLP